MKLINIYRNGRISKVLEVSKKELLSLKEIFNYISISAADYENLKNHDDNELVGIIAGDVQKILANEKGNYDCWFVFQPEKHGYKKLDEHFRGDFGDAIRLLKSGFKVARESWNGKGMWLIYIPGTDCEKCFDGTPYKEAGLDSVHIDSHIDMYTTKGTMQPGWLASQADMLAEDWMIVE
jgi:hypothetical protein